MGYKKRPKDLLPIISYPCSCSCREYSITRTRMREMACVRDLFRSYSSDVFGVRVFSRRKDEQLINVLKMENPKRPNFYFYARTLKEFGFQDIDIVVCTEVALSKSICKWKNYNRSMFVEELRKVYVRGSGYNERGDNFKTTLISSSSFSGIDIIQKFKALKHVPKMNLSDSNKHAAIQYYLNGVAALPRNFRPCKIKRCVNFGYCKHPDSRIKWKEYQNRLPTEKEILGWDYRAGICLIANDEYCFLDVDPEGKKLVDNDMFKGHFEHTPRGGYHFFAKAIPELKLMKVDGIELKVKGSLIVAYPTPGYTMGQEIDK